MRWSQVCLCRGEGGEGEMSAVSKMLDDVDKSRQKNQGKKSQDLESIHDLESHSLEI